MSVKTGDRWKDNKHPLGSIFQSIIRQGFSGSDRSLQRTLGPSEIGIDCDRALAYRLSHAEELDGDSDPLAAIIGIATHAWLADVFEKDNEQNQGYSDDGSARWSVERRVKLNDRISGTADLFDHFTGTVNDWKVVGPTSMTRYRSKGWSKQYRVQAHAYGLGYELLGFEVNEVMNTYIPRNGKLHEMHIISQPYDRDVAIEALERVERIAQTSHKFKSMPLDIEAIPVGEEGDEYRGQVDYQSIPKGSPDACTFCPFLNPAKETADAEGCPGFFAPR